MNNIFETFNHVRQPTLKAWNRHQMWCTISEEHGKEMASDYWNSFGQSDRTAMAIINFGILKYGKEQFHATLVRDLTSRDKVFEEDMEVVNVH